MSDSGLLFTLLALTAIAYRIGLMRSRTVAAASASSARPGAGLRMHSHPRYHGARVALWAVGPALLLLVLWRVVTPSFIEASLIAQIQSAQPLLSEQEVSVALRRITVLAGDRGFAPNPAQWEVAAAETLERMRESATWMLSGLIATAVALGGFAGYRRINPALRARDQIERTVYAVLMLSSGVAVLTTLGIVLSMVGETLRFFSFIDPIDFFFGATWQPIFHVTETSGYGHYGMLPLLGGTVLVAAVALAFAIPVGLMTAIYLAEYAPKSVRGVAKPTLEVLAGIPTIVYGVFALMTVGPLLSTAGELVGLNIRATSALTAGLVMGIMLIPFISSLSDDIITQVPGGLRDGSLGLGATRAETIRKVVLPVAMPGIAGAVLLAASRAVGETMIVVLAAGNAPNLTANPFEAVSTMTVTIVNQLTGDSDFAGPQSLVAFALGLTLFAITLALNVVALTIVRKYREQYE